MPGYPFSHNFIGKTVTDVSDHEADYNDVAVVPDGIIAFTSYEFIGERFAEFIVTDGKATMQSVYDQLTALGHVVLCIGSCRNNDNHPGFFDLDTPEHHDLIR